MCYELALNNDIYEFISDTYCEELKQLYEIDVDIDEIDEIIVRDPQELSQYDGMKFTGTHWFDNQNRLHLPLSTTYYKYFIIDSYGVNSNEIDLFINNTNCWQIDE